MEDELISFRVAKLSREKKFINGSIFGFKEYIVDWDNHKKGDIMDFSINPEEDSLIYNTDSYEKDTCIVYESPTQSLLQRWLREVHKIEVLVYCNASGWMWELNKTNGTHIKFSEYSGPNDAGQWDTYEEASDDGLYEALLLVK